MSSDIEIYKLANMIRSKRGARGLRDIAKEIGDISASTLSRIEQGNLPDIETYLKLCDWLGVPTEYFVNRPGEKQPLTKEKEIVAHLRADRTLDTKTSEALVQMITLAYQAANPIQTM